MKKNAGIVAIGVLVAIIVLTACGSTKVLTAEKTMIYNGSLYNLAGVSKMAASLEGKTADGETLDLSKVGKSQFNALFDKHGALDVTAAMNIGEESLPVETAKVSKYSDFEKIKKNLNKKMEKIAKFMADGKKTQLELK